MAARSSSATRSNPASSSGSSIADHSSSARSSCRRASAKANAARRRVAGPDRGLEGPPVVARGRPVVGQLRPVAGGDGAAPGTPLGERLGEGPMEPLPLAGQEVVVGGLLEQRVTERVVAVDRRRRPPGHQHLAADGRPQRVEQVGSSIAGDPREEVVVDPPAGDGRDADDGLGALRQADDAREEHLAERRRQRPSGGVLAGPEQLLDEERVAVRASVDLIGEVGGRRCAQDRREELAASRPGRGARRSSRSTRPLRSSSASHGSSGCRRCSSSARKVMTSTTRSVRRWRIRNAIVSRVAGSAQWRSSMTNRTGADLRQPLEHAQHRVEQAGLERFGLGRARPTSAAGLSDGTSRARSVWRSRHRLELVGIELPGEPSQRLDDRTVRDARRRRCRRSRR